MRATATALCLAVTRYLMRSIKIKKDRLSTNICFRVTEEELSFLSSLCSKYNCTIPQMLRIIIETEMEKIQHEHT